MQTNSTETNQLDFGEAQELHRGRLCLALYVKYVPKY